jgi:hypothetical protein
MAQTPWSLLVTAADTGLTDRVVSSPEVSICFSSLARNNTNNNS